jgi:hypothetical protein
MTQFIQLGDLIVNTDHVICVVKLTTTRTRVMLAAQTGGTNKLCDFDGADAENVWAHFQNQAENVAVSGKVTYK